MTKTNCVAYTSCVYSDTGTEYGKGAIGIVLTFPELTTDKIGMSGAMRRTTYNLLELESLLQTLESIPLPQRHNTLLIIKTTSNYIYDSFNKNWIYNWKKNNWKKSNGYMVKHSDVWRKILELKDHYYQVSIDIINKDNIDTRKAKMYAEKASKNNKSFQIEKFKITCYGG